MGVCVSMRCMRACVLFHMCVCACVCLCVRVCAEAAVLKTKASEATVSFDVYVCIYAVHV